VSEAERAPSISQPTIALVSDSLILDYGSISFCFPARAGSRFRLESPSASSASVSIQSDGPLANPTPQAALRTVGRERLAVVSTFGTESAALLKVMADIDPAIPVIFLDTGWLFEETLAYRDTLIAALGLRDVRSIKPLEQPREAESGARGKTNPICPATPLVRAILVR
jgi:hypothetical protein